MLPNLKQFVFLSQGVIHFKMDVGRRVEGIDVGDGADVTATEVVGVAVGGEDKSKLGTREVEPVDVLDVEPNVGI
jgi:hypothetical protein